MTVRTARCAFHLQREAAARCARCQRTFCRECVTEYRQAVYCSPCLQALLLTVGGARSRLLGGVRNAALAAFALIFFYLAFFSAARYLAHIPPELQFEALRGR